MSLVSAKNCPAMTTAATWTLSTAVRTAKPAALPPICWTATDHELTVIIPAYNEQRRLPKTLAALGAFLDTTSIEYRVLVADDGSSDDTARLTELYGPRFSTLRLDHAGKGCAVRSAMLAATGQVIAFTDADLPYELSALRQGYDWILQRQCEVVWGTRHPRTAEDVARRPWSRKLATRAFNTVVRRLVSTDLSDTQCGLKLFSRRAAFEIFSRAKVNGFAFDAEAVLLASRLGLSCRCMSVTLVNDHTSTVSLTRDAIPMLWDVFKARWRVGRQPIMPRLAEDWGRLPPDTARRAA